MAAGLPSDNGFFVYAGELFLALLLDADSVPDREITATVGQAVAEEGFREGRTGEPPDEHDVSWAIHETSNLCRALGLLASGGDWRDRSHGLLELLAPIAETELACPCWATSSLAWTPTLPPTRSSAPSPSITSASSPVTPNCWSASGTSRATPW